MSKAECLNSCPLALKHEACLLLTWLVEFRPWGAQNPGQERNTIAPIPDDERVETPQSAVRPAAVWTEVGGVGCAGLGHPENVTLSTFATW